MIMTKGKEKKKKKREHLGRPPKAIRAYTRTTLEKSFVPGKNETMFNKIDSVLGQKLAADVLQDFKKSGPKLDMTKFNVNIPEDPAKTTSVKKQAKAVDPGMGPK